MILPDMTCQQMMDVIRKDKPLIIEEDKRYIKAGGLRAARRQNARYPMHLSRIWTSPLTHQRYLLEKHILKRSDAFSPSHYIGAVALVNTDDGIETVAPHKTAAAEDEGLMVIMPHVYSRYKERMHLDISGEELIKYFNARSYFQFLEHGYRRSKDNTSDIMLSILDGALFGNRDPQDERRLIMRTFVADETMQEGYKAKFKKQFGSNLEESIFALKMIGNKRDAFEATLLSKHKQLLNNHVQPHS